MSARWVVAGLVALALAWTARPARADATDEVIALVVTNNRSAQLGRPELQYADDDGAKYYAVFRAVAAAASVELLTDFDRDSAALFPDARAVAHSPTRAGVAAAVERLAARAREAAAAGRRVVFYFVFAGHGDVDRGRGFLELTDGRLTSDDIEAMLKVIPAARAHVILDSCNSFFVLNPRRPGGRQLAVTEDAARSLSDRLPDVGVFLSTSAEAEVFEWSELEAGIFSHAVRSGLLGGADVGGDGAVSYDELRAFVETSNKAIENPLFRPRIFARGPNGHNDEPIFDLRGARAPRDVLEGQDHRVTVRDVHDLPWIDVHPEPGARVTLYTPFDVAASADGVGARGPNEVLAKLFAAPFGPRAFAQWRAESAAQTPPVYGISAEDAERMRLLLYESADLLKQGRRAGGAALIATGAVFAAGGTWMLVDHALPLADPKQLGWTLVAEGAAFATFGTALVALPTDGERLYDDYVREMAQPSVDGARVVATTERRFLDLADRARARRAVARTLGWTLAGLSTTAFVLDVTLDPNAQRRLELGVTSGIVGLTGLAVAVIGSVPSPIERLADVWVNDPGIQRLPRTYDPPRVAVAPLPGGAALLLTGGF